MGCYTKIISPASQDMKIIVTEFGKFIYNRFPMEICASGDIYQEKVLNYPYCLIYFTVYNYVSGKQ